MKNRLSFHPLGLPLSWQLLGIIVGALIVAQFVTLALTILIPPAPMQRWNMQEVAASLLGTTQSDALERRVIKGPPDISGTGWLISETSRQALANEVGKPVGDVVLAFYTQLPVGGVSVPVNEAQNNLQETTFLTPAKAVADMIVPVAHAQGQPGGPPPGGMPGGSFPGGGFPGGGFPGGPVPGSSMPGGSMPSGRTPTSQPRTDTPSPKTTQVQNPAQNAPQNSVQGPASNSAQNASQNSTPPSGSSPAPIGQSPQTATPGPTPSAGAPMGATSPSGIGPRPVGSAPFPNGTAVRPTTTQPVTLPSRRSPVATPVTAPTIISPTAQVPGPVSPTLTDPGSVPANGGILPQAEGALSPESSRTNAVNAAPIPFRQDEGFLSFTTPPFIEGDFIAAMKQADGNWVAVAPRAEPFPNSWQKRVMLWFVLSLLIVGPVMWIFARRIVKPLEQFAETAEILGRDPGASVLPLSGPAEMGRAAHAFNQMQSRLRAFVDDRTTTVGAISHDLRTPLTRLRFRIEDVPDEQREALLYEVDDMELMISQVINFIREASTHGLRQAVDLGALVENSAADARVAGGIIETEISSHKAVDADVMGLRRLLANLIENALKYGDKAWVRVSDEGDMVIAEIIDNGPGIAEDEWDDVFTPFYRSEEARNSGKPGSGLGLAVCRSIARAHGGDVALERRAEGFVAKLSLPASFIDHRASAA